MMTTHVKIEIDSANAAFSDGPHEVARILRDLADKFERDGHDNHSRRPVRDVNGNTVGHAFYGVMA
jgi:hypothetical protein